MWGDFQNVSLWGELFVIVQYYFLSIRKFLLTAAFWASNCVLLLHCKEQDGECALLLCLQKGILSYKLDSQINITQFSLSSHPPLTRCDLIPVSNLNSDLYARSIRQLNNFHRPMTTIATYQKGIHHTGIKIFNSLPQSIEDVSNNARKFENGLKRSLHTHSFYSVEEYFLHTCSTN
jgi:hypothetical protein